jgi:hypothetical protein
MEQHFDNHWGIRTQRALMEYIKLVRAGGFNPVSAHGEGSQDGQQYKIQQARDRVENEQLQPRESFEKVFHHLNPVGTKDLTEQLRRYEQYLTDLPIDFTDPSFVRFHRQGYSTEPLVAPPVVQQRTFLENAISEMKAELASREEEKPVEDPVDVIAAQIRQQIEIEARLRRQCEKDVEKYPDQEETIRRSYRRAIDALREQG